MEGQQTPLESSLSDEQDIQKNKFLALLSYFFILFLIPLIVGKKSKFAQFNARQGFVLFMVEFFLLVPVINWVFAIPVVLIVVVALIKVLQGKYWRAPIVGQIADSINI